MVRRKRITTYCFLGLLMASLWLGQLAEVAKANPGLHGAPPLVIINSPGDGASYSNSAIPVHFTVFITGYAVSGIEKLKWVTCTIAKYSASQDSWVGNLSVPLDYKGPVSLDISGNYSSVVSLSNGKYVLSVTGQTDAWSYSGSLMGDLRSFAKETFFTVDTPVPQISNFSIENKTYTKQDISLNFTVNETPSSVWYSLDNKTEVPLNATSTMFLLSLTELSEGYHSLVVYANDTFGNTGKSDIIYFNVDTTQPTFSELSIQNLTYSASSLPVTFLTNEIASWIVYSLDGEANSTVNGNFTLNRLWDGTHNIVIYANDTAGNIGKSDVAFFTIDTTPPEISNLSVQNKTYSSKDIPLSFHINETTSWIGYRLDNQANVNADGNITLTALSEGTHKIVLYSNDSFGNMGKSETVFFTVNSQVSLPIILGIVAVIIVAVATSLVYLKKRLLH